DDEERRGDDFDLRRDLFVLIANRAALDDAHFQVGAFVRFAGRVGDALQRALDGAERAAGAAAEKLQLLLDLRDRAGGGEFFGHVGELRVDPVAAAAERRHRDAERDYDRAGAAE